MAGVLSTLSLMVARQTRQRGTTIKHFAEHTGLVYFGAVDHTKDDHEVIRGLTVSTSHKDRHYAVGTYDGYDLAIVDRYDTCRSHISDHRAHNWTIVEVTLRHQRQNPHIFLLPTHRSDHFTHLFAGNRHLAPISQFTDLQLQSEFATRYVPHSAPRDFQEAAVWLSRHSHGIAAHFWPHAIELKANKLYIYITEHRLSETVLGSAVESALWLADALDRSEN